MAYLRPDLDEVSFAEWTPVAPVQNILQTGHFVATAGANDRRLPGPSRVRPAREERCGFAGPFRGRRATAPASIPHANRLTGRNPTVSPPLTAGAQHRHAGRRIGRLTGGARTAPSATGYLDAFGRRGDDRFESAGEIP